MEKEYRQKFHQLREQGYLLFRADENQDFVAAIIKSPLLATEISVDAANSRLLKTSKTINLHTDHVRVNYIAWNCISQAPKGGESLLLDTRPFIDTLSTDEKISMSCIQVGSHKAFPDDKQYYPLLKTNGDLSWQIYYASWFILEADSPEKEKVLKKFQQWLEKQEPQAIRLCPGDSLVINNHRMLHGRNAFGYESGRKLMRFWIESIPSHVTL